VLHECDNPSCFNPRHLSFGTYARNLRDCVARGRNRNANKTHCSKGHVFSAKNTYVWGTMRQCKTCNLEIAKRRYHKRKESQSWQPQ
jgi:hypothetical protein